MTYNDEDLIQPQHGAFHYSKYDSQKYPDFVRIVEFLGGEEPSDEEIWEMARQSTKIPVMDNIRYMLILGNITSLLEEKFGIKNYFINGLDTHLYIGDEEIYNVDDLEAYLQKKGMDEI